MPVFSGTAQTRMGMGGWGVRPAGSFAGKALAAVITIIAIDATWDGTGPIPEGIYKNVTSSTNEIKIQGKLVGGVQQTIDGQNSISITTGFGQVHLISDGTNLMKFD